MAASWQSAAALGAPQRWGRAGAGFLFVARAAVGAGGSGWRVLLFLRSEDVMEPGTWGLPGGKLDGDEDPLEAAEREVSEECGDLLSYELRGRVVFREGERADGPATFVYTTFIAEVSSDWEPAQLNWENDAAEWFELDQDWRVIGLDASELHFGVRHVLEQLRRGKMERARGSGAARLEGIRGLRGYQGTREDVSTAVMLPRAGARVSGLEVLDDVPNMGSIAASFSTWFVLPGIREVPFAAFGDGAGHPSRSERVVELARAIKTSGQIKPLIVAVDDEGPYILEGGHRFDALQLLGVASFPALVVLDEDP